MGEFHIQQLCSALGRLLTKCCNVNVFSRLQIKSNMYNHEL